MRLTKLAAMLCAAVLFVPQIPADAAGRGFTNIASVAPCDDGSYQNSDDGMYITGFTGEIPADLVIPEIFEGLPVVGIADDAFFPGPGMKTVTFPKTLLTIGRSSFQCCYDLQKVSMNEGLISIGESAFEQCKLLTNVTIPTTVESLGDYAFRICNGLKTISLPEKGALKTIGKGTFEHCSSLTDVTIPASVSYIGPYAFGNCTALKSITILNPECTIDSGKQTISNETSGVAKAYYRGVIRGYCGSTAEEYAKKNDYLFEPLDPENTTTTARPSHVFEEQGFICDNIKAAEIRIIGTTDDLPEDVVIPTMLRGIMVNAVASMQDGADRIKSVVVPESVTDLYIDAFCKMKKLECITFLNPETFIPESQRTICNGTDAFDPYYNGVIRGYAGSTAQKYAEKYGLKFEELPPVQSGTTPIITTGPDESSQGGTTTTTTVASNPAFDADGTCLLDGIRYRNQGSYVEVIGYINTQLSIKTKVKSEVGGLPVTVIAPGAFAEVKGVQEITIPISVTMIGSGAFRCCPDLRNLVIMNPGCGFTGEPSMICNSQEGENYNYIGVVSGFEGSNIEGYCNLYHRFFNKLTITTGDLDFDGYITIEDAQDALNAYVNELAGNRSELIGQQITAGDINHDGAVTAEDAQFILQYYTEKSIALNPITWDDLLKK